MLRAETQAVLAYGQGLVFLTGNPQLVFSFQKYQRVGAGLLAIDPDIAFYRGGVLTFLDPSSILWSEPSDFLS